MLEIKRITKREAKETLRSMGLTRFSKKWKHSKRYYMIKNIWNRREQQNDSKLYRKFNKKIKKYYKLGFITVQKTKKDSVGYTQIVGFCPKTYAQKPTTRKYCAKCGQEIIQPSYEVMYKDLCNSCYDKWLKIDIPKLFEKWLEYKPSMFT